LDALWQNPEEEESQEESEEESEEEESSVSYSISIWKQSFRICNVLSMMRLKSVIII